MVLIYTAVAGTGAALLMFQRYQDRTAAQAQLQAELAAARLQALRGHLEPHFLFNGLHSIAALARQQDTAGVVRLTASLSEILRHVLAVGDRPSRLGDELAVVERYLEIQRARFADRLDVALSVAADVADARVPLLVVQPLVENALKHGLGPRVQPGLVRVAAWRNDGQTHITVEDDGVGLPAGWTLDSIRARDKAGNVGSWSGGYAWHPRLVQESHGDLTYTGAWSTDAAAGASADATRMSTAAGASVKYTFSGRAVAWVTRLAPSSGEVAVYIDGDLVATIDTHADAMTERFVAFTTGWASYAKHTIKLVVVDTADRPRVDLDAFEVIS